MGPDIEVRRADLRSTLRSLARVARLAQEPGVPLGGWSTDDPAPVNAQGIVSEAATHRMFGFFDQLPDLTARLEAGGAVLDVGAGAGGVGNAVASTPGRASRT